MENLNKKRTSTSLKKQSILLSQLEILKERNNSYKFNEKESLFVKDSWVRYRTTYIKSKLKNASKLS